MMPVGVFVIMISFFVVAVSLLIATGIVICKDANAHGMKGGLWALIAVFGPNFIGVIIYLIVRHGVEKQYSCSNCGIRVEANYNICPSCKGTFEKMCGVCKNAVKGNMAYCPYCGNKVEEGENEKTASKVAKKTNIVKPLAIIGSIYIATFVIVMVSMFTLAFTSGELMMDTSVMEMEVNTFNRMESTFKYKNGNEDINFKLEAGEVQPIDIEIGLTSGTIQLRVTDPNNQMIHEKMYQVGNYEETLMIEAVTAGRYEVDLFIEEASGNYKIHKVKQGE